MKASWVKYLRSAHWLEFRASVLAERKQCQWCMGKRRLTVHHKHYLTVGKERHEDVIVLCWPCHEKKHNVKKWVKAKNKRQVMDFTAITKDPSTIGFYNLSKELRKCARCAQMHPVFYKKFRDGRTMLATACPNSKPRTMYVPFEAGLDVPTIGSTGKQKTKTRMWAKK